MKRVRETEERQSVRKKKKAIEQLDRDTDTNKETETEIQTQIKRQRYKERQREDKRYLYMMHYCLGLPNDSAPVSKNYIRKSQPVRP